MPAFQRCGCCKECFPGCWFGKFGNMADAGARLTEIIVRASCACFKGWGRSRSVLWVCRPIFYEVVCNTEFELRISFSFFIWWGAVLDCGSCLKGVVGTPYSWYSWVAISGSSPIFQNPFADSIDFSSPKLTTIFITFNVSGQLANIKLHAPGSAGELAGPDPACWIFLLKLFATLIEMPVECGSLPPSSTSHLVMTRNGDAMH
jgi:hypothetical protein